MKIPFERTARSTPYRGYRLKRIVMLALFTVLMAGLFAANQAEILARSPETARDNMDTANLLYEGGRFAEAVHAYEQLVDSGIADSALFYNLGNAYFRQADYGRAILNYRRAQQLDPTDRDVEANLTLARSMTAEQSDSNPDSGPVAGLLRSVRRLVTLEQASMAALGLWMLFLPLLVVMLDTRKDTARRRVLRNTCVITALLLATAVLALGGLVQVESAHAGAVVVADQVAVRSGPGSQYTSEFDLHSGAEVATIETRGSWSRLAPPGGEWEGWVPAQDVEAIWD